MRCALVIGCSDNVWEEVDEAIAQVNEWRYGEKPDAEPHQPPRTSEQDYRGFDAFYCVKLAGVHWDGGRFTWITLHPEFMDDYEAQRKALGLHDDYEIVAPMPGEVGMHGKKGRISRRVSYRYPGMNSSASSGGYAAKVALEDGFDRVILAGVPMVAGSGHFTRKKEWLSRDSFTQGFQLSLKHWNGRVRSMSGWSAEILGVPTREWLNGETP